MTEHLYKPEILRLASSIPHLGRLAKADGTAIRRSAVCGSHVVVDVVVDGEGLIVELGQDVHACALGQASASIMASYALGRGHQELLAVRSELGSYLAGQIEGPSEIAALEVFAPARTFKARHAAILLPFEAVIEALEAAVQSSRGGGGLLPAAGAAP